MPIDLYGNPYVRLINVSLKLLFRAETYNITKEIFFNSF